MDYGFWIFDFVLWIFEFWILDFYFGNLGFGVFGFCDFVILWIFDVGFLILGFGFWVLDSGFWILVHPRMRPASCRGPRSQCRLPAEGKQNTHLLTPACQPPVQRPSIPSSVLSAGCTPNRWNICSQCRMRPPANQGPKRTIQSARTWMHFQ